MSFKVKMGKQSGNFKVKLGTPSNDITLKNFSGTKRLDELLDVNAANSNANGSILIYDSVTDTYIQRDIFSFDDEGKVTISGGEF
jgi:hypothetical protein